MHSIFSPSASHRWINCTASLTYSDIPQTSTPAADLGTALHTCSYEILSGLYTPRNAVGKKINGIEIDKSRVVDTIIPYIEFVKELTGNNGMVLAETRSVLVEGFCFGTADALIIKHNPDDTVTLIVIDLKTGQRRVPSINNTQLLIYAAGLYWELSLLYKIKEVRAGICQPPLNNYDVVTITFDQIVQITKEVEAVIDKVLVGDIEYSPGKGICDYCPGASANVCPALKKIANNAAKRDFTYLLDNPHIIPLLKTYVSNAEAEIRKRLLNNKVVPGYKLVNGRSKREWAPDKETLENELTNRGLKKEWLEKVTLASPKMVEDELKYNGLDIDISDLVKVSPGEPLLTEDTNNEALDPHTDFNDFRKK